MKLESRGVALSAEDVEWGARFLAESQEDSNCPNPPGHWYGEGMPAYHQWQRDEYREMADTMLMRLGFDTPPWDDLETYFKRQDAAHGLVTEQTS